MSGQTQDQQFVPNIELDFFNIYKLARFDQDTHNFGGFLPVTIQNASWYNNITEPTLNVKLVLPWNSAEGSSITDTVSVSYGAKSGGTVERLFRTYGATEISKIAASLGLDDIGDWFAKTMTTEYDPSSLSKNLDVQFILPLINPEKAIAEDSVKFTDTVMSALGVLQGLVYPRKYGFSYPYLLGVSIGEVYTNFKAFLRDVSIKFDGPMIDIGGKMFPQIITGTLRFINVFFYAWGDKDGSFLESMDLYKNPRVLFGEKTLGTEATNIKNNVSEYTAASNLFSLSSTSTVEGFFGKQIESIVNDSPFDSQIDESLRDTLNEIIKEPGALPSWYPSQSENFSVDYYNDVDSFLGYNNSWTDEAFQLEKFDKLNLNHLNISDSLTELNMNLFKALRSVDSIYQYKFMFEVIDPDDIRSIGRVINIFSPLGNILYQIYDAQGIIAGITKRVNGIINVGRATEIHQNPSSYSTTVSSIDVEDSSALEDFSNIIGANLLSSYHTFNALNRLNLANNVNPENLEDMAAYTAVCIGNNTMLQMEILNKHKDIFDCNDILEEKCEQLYNKKLVDSNTLNAVRKLNTNTKKIDYTYVNTMKDVLYDSLSSVYSTLVLE